MTPPVIRRGQLRKEDTLIVSVRLSVIRVTFSSGLIRRQTLTAFEAPSSSVSFNAMLSSRCIMQILLV